MKKINLKSGEVLIIRTAIPEDSNEFFNYKNKVAGESDNASYGPGEFGMTVEQVQKYIRSLKDSKNCINILGLIKNK